jgi:hypothetical protein
VAAGELLHFERLLRELGNFRCEEVLKLLNIDFFARANCARGIHDGV